MGCDLQSPVSQACPLMPSLHPAFQWWVTLGACLSLSPRSPHPVLSACNFPQDQTLLDTRVSPILLTGNFPSAPSSFSYSLSLISQPYANNGHFFCPCENKISSTAKLSTDKTELWQGRYFLDRILSINTQENSGRPVFC